MRLIRSDGRVLEVRALGPVVYRLEAARVPIKLHGSFILDDAEARELIRRLAQAQRSEAPR